MAGDGYLNSLNTWVPESDVLAFKTAFYCTLFAVFTCVSFAALLAVVLLLRNFLKPFLWAVICGTALFPMKKHVSRALNTWLEGLKQNNTPLLLGIAVAPLTVVDHCSSLLVDLVFRKAIMKLVLACVIVRYAFAVLTFDAVVAVATWSWTFFDKIIEWGASSPSIILAVLLGAGCICCFLFSKNFNRDLLRYSFLPVWFVVFCLFVKLFYPVHMLVAFALIVVLVLMKVNVSLPASTSSKEPTDSSSSDSKESNKVDELPANFSDYCMEMMLGVSIIMFVIKHPTLLMLLALLLLYGLLRRSGVVTAIHQRIDSLLEAMKAFLKRRQLSEFPTVFVPRPLNKLLGLIFTGNLRVIESTQSSVEFIATAAVVSLLLVSTLLLGILLFVQLNSEIVHLVTLLGSITQQNSKLSEFVSNFVKLEGGESLADNVYLQTKMWLSTQARNLAAADDLEKADMIENHVQMLLDKLYTTFNTDSETYPHKDMPEMSHLWDVLKSLNVMDMVHENLNLLSSVMQTAWMVIRVNMDIAFVAFSTIFAFIVDVGFDILRFLLQIVVFLTSLYYLLAFSGNEFLPLEWTMSMIPVIPAVQSNRYLLLKAIQRSVRQIFLLTFKMATFYGFYVWFLYSLFDLTVTVIPTVTASVLAAVPFVAPYWVCLPGVLELWLVKGNSFLAIGLAISSILPSFVVDPYFYEELKGTHPYLTGLSIVGGLYWLGLEGAIFGPILLCCLSAIVSICREVVANA